MLRGCWPVKLSQYRDWLQAGRTEDRNPVGERYSAPIHTGHGIHPASYKMGNESSSAVVKKEYSYNSTYPYGLYRDSVPVKRVTGSSRG